jgi:YD repeat-containing protein
MPLMGKGARWAQNKYVRAFDKNGSSRVRVNPWLVVAHTGLLVFSFSVYGLDNPPGNGGGGAGAGAGGAGVPLLPLVSVPANRMPDVVETFGTSSIFGMAEGPRVAPPLHVSKSPNSIPTLRTVTVNAKADKTKSPCDQAQGGDPVILSTGAKVEAQTDFALPGEMGLQFTRYYNSNFYVPGLKGRMGVWTTSYDYILTDDVNQDPKCNSLATPDTCPMVLIHPDGSIVQFAAGTTHPDGSVSYQQLKNGVATLIQNSDHSFVVHDEDSKIMTYSNQRYLDWLGGRRAQLSSVKDLAGVGWNFSYPDANTTVVAHTSGQKVTLSTHFNSDDTNKNVVNRTLTVTDPAGHIYTYGTVDALSNWNFTYQGYLVGELRSAALPGTPATTVTYAYDEGVFGGPYHYALNEVDYNGTAHDKAKYDSQGRAIQTQMADGSQQTSISYDSNATGPTASVTNALGHVAVYQFNSNLDVVSVTGRASTLCAASFSGRTYDGNENVQSETDANGNVTKYTYAANGEIQQKVEAAGTPGSRTTNFVWDTTAGTDRMLSVTIVGALKTAFAYNDQGRLASVTQTNLSANGVAQQSRATTYSYTLYANGLVSKGIVTPPSTTNTLTNVYDTLGNVSSVTNGLAHTTTYSNYNGLGEPGRVVDPNGVTTDFTYDARGLTLTRTTYPNGAVAAWSYGYDVFGLLNTLTAPDGQVTNWYRNAVGVLQTVTRNDKDGTSTETFGHDANGDVTSDTVTRGSDVGLSQTITYDELGRVYQKLGNHGQVLTYGYDGNGNIQSVTDAMGHVKTYQYDALDRVTQVSESNGATPPAITVAPVLSVLSRNTTGSYAVSWTATANATSYTLQEQANGGPWVNVLTSGATSWSTSGQQMGNYSYRVQGCNAGGCGPLSAVSTVNVLFAPTQSPSLTVPATNNNGNYAVTWTAISGATAYTLQQQINGGAWNTTQSGASTSKSISGEGTGTYSYRAQACNASGCGPWSPATSVAVTLPPGSAPVLTTSIPNPTNGNETIDWTSVATATNYDLQWQMGGGAWSMLASGTSLLSWMQSLAGGTYGFQVRACNSGGCGPWSSVKMVTVLLRPVCKQTTKVCKQVM